MRNPFAMMAIMAAAMADAFRENAYRDAGMSMPKARSRSRTPGARNPAGSKLVMRFYKAKHGVKAKSVEEAMEWYRKYNPQPVARAAVRAPKLPKMKLAA